MDVQSEEAIEAAGLAGIELDCLALAPFVARYYHNGQGSALYALSSSGMMVQGLQREAAAASILADTLGEVEDFEALRAVSLFAGILGL